MEEGTFKSRICFWAGFQETQILEKRCHPDLIQEMSISSKKIHKFSLPAFFLIQSSLPGVVVFDNGATNIIDTTIPDYVEVEDSPGGATTTVVVNSPAQIQLGDPVGDDGLYLFDSSIGIINGGTIVQDVGADHQSSVTVNAGSILDDLQGFADATINLHGGTVGGDFEIYDGVAATISGGFVGGDLQVFSPFASLSMTGGTIGEDIQVDGFMSIRGGIFLGQNLDFGLATLGGQIVLFGTNFRIDGIPVGNGDIVPEFGILTGVLENGDPINIPINRNPLNSVDPIDIGTITLVPEPSTGLLAGIAVMAIALRRRRRS